MDSINIKKDDFNKLEIKEQVNFINKYLEDMSLTKVCDSIEIDRATIRKRFKKEGYVLNKKTSKYEKTDNIPNTSNTKTSKTSDSSIDVKVLSKDVTILKSQIKTLEKSLADIKKQIPEKNTNNIINTDIKIEIFDGELVNRAYKIDKDIQQDFKTFCKQHSEYRVSDILSTILKQYLENNS